MSLCARRCSCCNPASFGVWVIFEYLPVFGNICTDLLTNTRLGMGFPGLITAGLGMGFSGMTLACNLGAGTPTAMEGPLAGLKGGPWGTAWSTI